MRRRLRWWLAAFTVLAGTIFLSRCGNETMLLTPNQAVERDSPGDGFHIYRFQAKSGEYIRLSLEQQCADIWLSVHGPSGEAIGYQDSLNRYYGGELICFIARETGPHILELGSHTPVGKGGYRLLLDQPRTPGVGDVNNAHAFELQSRADTLSRDQNPDKLRKALSLFSESRKLWQDGGEPEQVALILLKEADLWGRLWQSQRQINCLEQATSLFKAIGQSRVRAMTLHGMGTVYYRIGRYEQAIHHYQRSLDLRVLPDLDRAETLLELGFSHVVTGLVEQGNGYLEEARQIYVAKGHSPGLARIQKELGWIDYREGRLDQAVSHLQEALSLIKSRGDPAEVGILDRLGTCLSETGRFEEAMDAYRKALALVPETMGSDWTPVLYSNIGKLLVERGRYEDGLAYLTTARESFEESGKSAEVSHSLFISARAEHGLDHLEQAVANLERALDISTGLHRETRDPGMRAAYRASRHVYTDYYLDLMMELSVKDGDPARQHRILAYLERTRARNLVNVLMRDPSKPGPVNRELLREAAAVQTEIATRSWRKNQKTSTDRGSGTGEIGRLITRYDHVWSELQPTEIQKSPEELTIQEIQDRLLDEQTVLLFYAMGQEWAWLWVVKHDGISAHRLGSRSEVEAAAREYYRRVKHRNVDRFRDRISEVGGRLGDFLVGPAVEAIADKRLLITMDGDLQYIPIGALPMPGDTGEPLVAHHEIVYLHSASALTLLLDRNASRRRSFESIVVFAAPAFHEDSGFDPLPFTEREAEAIGALFPGTAQIHLGVHAAKKEIFTKQVSNAQILHFATHGILYPNRGELSALVLATRDATGNPVDGFLRSYEIRDLDLSADLVVLSACDTALGEQLRGEGLVGLPQSFLEAGAGGVLVSLWRVDDHASNEMMVYFYRRLLLQGMGPSAALRGAQNEIRRQARWRDPYYWAGFIFQGDWSGFTKKKD